MPVGRLLVLIAALAGLFAMHGMSDHGTMNHARTDTHGPAGASDAAVMAAAEAAAEIGDDRESHAAMSGSAGAAPLDRDHPNRAIDAVPDAALASVAAVAAAADDTADGGLQAAMSLCLAILAAAAVLLLRRLRTWASPHTLALIEASQRVVPSRARAPDPPNLHALCIHRC